MGLFKAFKFGIDKPPVVASLKNEDVATAAEKILSPEEKEKMRIIREFLTLAKNVDEIAKRDPEAGFKKIDYLVDEAENIKKLSGIDVDFKKRQMIADELLKIAANIPESEKYIRTDDGMVKSSSLDIIVRRAFGVQ